MFPIDFWTLKCIKVSDNDQLVHIKSELMADGGFEISYYHCMLMLMLTIHDSSVSGMRVYDHGSYGYGYGVCSSTQLQHEQ